MVTSRIGTAAPHVSNAMAKGSDAQPAHSRACSIWKESQNDNGLQESRTASHAAVRSAWTTGGAWTVVPAGVAVAVRMCQATSFTFPGGGGPDSRVRRLNYNKFHCKYTDGCQPATARQRKHGAAVCVARAVRSACCALQQLGKLLACADL